MKRNEHSNLNIPFFCQIMCGKHCTMKSIILIKSIKCKYSQYFFINYSKTFLQTVCMLILSDCRQLTSKISNFPPKLEIFFQNFKFSSKISNFLPKFQIFFQNFKFSSKSQIFFKISNFIQKLKFFSKSQIFFHT